MEKQSAYSLYKKGEDFKVLLFSKGFVIDEYGRITPKRSPKIMLGQLSKSLDYLVLFDNYLDNDNRVLFRRGISRLQKLADEFNSISQKF